MKKRIEKEVYKLLKIANQSGYFPSYTNILEAMYEVATKKKQYEKGHYILELMNEEYENINI
jgi:hypothetical protein